MNSKFIVILNSKISNFLSMVNGLNITQLVNQDHIFSILFPGIAIDWVGRNLYWTDSGRRTIEVASLDNPGLRRLLFDTNVKNPRGIALNPTARYGMPQHIPTLYKENTISKKIYPTFNKTQDKKVRCHADTFRGRYIQTYIIPKNVVLEAWWPPQL